MSKYDDERVERLKTQIVGYLEGYLSDVYLVGHDLDGRKFLHGKVRNATDKDSEDLLKIATENVVSIDQIG